MFEPERWVSGVQGLLVVEADGSLSSWNNIGKGKSRQGVVCSGRIKPRLLLQSTV